MSLLDAIQKKDISLLKVLVNQTPLLDINATEPYVGMTLLMFAVMGTSRRIVKILLDAGADINIVNNDGDSALDIVEQSGNTRMYRLLTQYHVEQNNLNISRSNTF
jgi:ankyrin repeat protein